MTPHSAPAPKRIQRKRTRGWRMPEGAVYVGRPTKWGNPFVAVDDGQTGHGTDHTMTPQMAVYSFKNMLLKNGGCNSVPVHKWPKGKIPAEWITVEDVKRELRGKDLACWCRTNQPCHADILLEIANA